jgi:hypothetical protein
LGAGTGSQLFGWIALVAALGFAAVADALLSIVAARRPRT